MSIDRFNHIEALYSRILQINFAKKAFIHLLPANNKCFSDFLFTLYKINGSQSFTNNILKIVYEDSHRVFHPFWM